MTNAPFRIERPNAIDVGAGSEPDIKGYLDRLLKLIPAEVVALYVAGIRIIPAAHTPVLGAWLLICLGLVFVIRRYGTANKRTGVPPQGKAIAFSAIAFVIWAYSLGGVFAAFSWYPSFSYIGGLLILGYTTVLPYVYRGD